jgi:pyruvate kinase
MEKICLNSDAVMIDRGDISAEIGEKNLFEATDKIISFCKKNGIPTILATENLDSMLTNQTPSKSEIMSLAYFVSKKIDRIMLSDETATSKNWKNILIWLKTFLAKNINKKIIQEKDDFSIWQLLKNFSTLPIILFTKKGYAINNLLKLENTYTPIIFTDNKKIYNLNNLREKVISLLTKKFKKKGISSFINKNIIKNLKLIFSEKDKAILVYIADPKRNSRANTIQLISREDYKI